MDKAIPVQQKYRRHWHMHRVSWRIIFAMTLVVSVGGTIRNASAGIILLTSRTGLAPNDLIDWGQLGSDSASLPSSNAVTSLNGLKATVSTTDPAGLLRLDEGVSWVSNFTIGDRLIDNNSFSYFPLNITFSSPVRGAGAQIQPDSTTDPSGAFTATIQAFSGSDSLGTFTENGLRANNEDGSAIFIGVFDTTQEITSITIGIANPPPSFGDFAINSLALNTSTAVPEPHSFLLTGLALLILSGLWWCKCLTAAKER
jgi:hypothetical protein